MSDHPFLRFINLVSLDQKIQSCENEKSAISTHLATIKKQKEEYAHNLGDMKQRVFLLKKRVDEQELEMKVLDQKEKQKKQLLENISDYREYQSIKVEVEAVQRMQVEQERIVLEAWNQLENTESLLQKKAKESKEVLHALQNQEQALEQKFISLQNEIDQLIVQRLEKETTVPAEWLEKYTMMRARVTDPVVEIFHQSCGSCSNTITAQEMTRAKHGALLQCQSCFRLLYAPEIMAKHA